MLARTWSAALHGVDAFTVEVEVNATDSGNEDIITVVGMPDAAVKESRDRVKSSMSATGYFPPRGRTTVNLAPADVRKEGSGFDLPIALCLIAAQNHFDRNLLSDVMIAGELALDGQIRPVNGALSIAMHARAAGFEELIVPHENAEEAGVADGLKVYGLSHLTEAVDFFRKNARPAPVQVDVTGLAEMKRDGVPDFVDVKGQETAKRAMEIAAAGGHNVLMLGSPGTGKTMLAKRLPSILPPLTLNEALEVTKVHSIAGTLPGDTPLILDRPFRAPHHTISDAGLLGGQSQPRPGEISLAHNGVIFLDELPEFKRNVLEVLRQPLENGEVTISRATGSCRFPADFMMLAAMNPCPCGYYGSVQRECRCSSNQIQRYRSRISGPLLDRIDIHVEVAPLTEKELTERPQGESSEQIRQRVIPARKAQEVRYGEGSCRWNAQMSPQQMEDCCTLTEDCKDLLRGAIQSINLSARAYNRILRVARTIADLDQEDEIAPHHLSEAIQYRAMDRQNW